MVGCGSSFKACSEFRYIGLAVEPTDGFCKLGGLCFVHSREARVGAELGE